MEKRGQTAPISVAPMMDRTDRYYRVMMREITRRTLLYTEMIPVTALLNGDQEHLIGFEDIERPMSLQLGGSDPAGLAACAKLAELRGYDEVNINVGCPSDRVQSGRFGACLMREPELVAASVSAMRDAVDIPVTVKHRIGVDDLDRYEDMAHFVEVVAAAGADRFTVHARKAWLKGLSPKQNRTVPPIRYDDVYRLKDEFPHLDIEINGHIKTLDEIRTHLERVDAVMIGRAAWDRPFLFSTVDQELFGDDTPVPTRDEVVAAMSERMKRGVAAGIPQSHFLRPLLNLFNGVPGARRWKQTISQRGYGRSATPHVLDEALAAIQEVWDRSAHRLDDHAAFRSR